MPDDTQSFSLDRNANADAMTDAACLAVDHIIIAGMSEVSILACTNI